MALPPISHRHSSLSSSSSSACTMGSPFASYSFTLPIPVHHLLSLLTIISRAVSLLLVFLHLIPPPPPPPSQARTNLFLPTSDNLLLSTAVSMKYRLPVVEFERLGGESPSTACVVCLATVEARDQVRILGNCRHAFHVACIDRWIDADGLTCPLCRSPLLPSPEEIEMAEKGILGNFFSRIRRVSSFVHLLVSDSL